MHNKIIPAIVILILLYACKKEVTENKLFVPAPLANIQSSTEPTFVYGTDWSGAVQTVRVMRFSPDLDTSHIVDVDVPDDYVLVGGGAVTVELWQQHNGYLTAAIPDTNLRTWHTASQSHNVPFFHRLYAYAIGLKIQGVSREELISHLQVVSYSGTLSIFAAARIDTSRYRLIGGGGQVSAGNNALLLSGSFPFETYWTAFPREFKTFTNGQSVMRAIGISKELLELKGLETNQRNSESFGNYGTLIGEMPVDSSWVTTGAGAYSTFLSGIMPSPHHMNAAGNNPLSAANPFMYTYMLRMRKKLPGS